MLPPVYPIPSSSKVMQEKLVALFWYLGPKVPDLNNFLEGAIIGGAIGNNIPGEKGGGALGAFLGGVLNTEQNKGNQCRMETRYEEEYKEVYSHSVITFTHEGRTYSVRFQK